MTGVAKPKPCPRRSCAPSVGGSPTIHKPGVPDLAARGHGWCLPRGVLVGVLGSELKAALRSNAWIVPAAASSVALYGSTWATRRREHEGDLGAQGRLRPSEAGRQLCGQGEGLAAAARVVQRNFPMVVTGGARYGRRRFFLVHPLGHRERRVVECLVAVHGADLLSCIGNAARRRVGSCG